MFSSSFVRGRGENGAALTERLAANDPAINRFLAMIELIICLSLIYFICRVRELCFLRIVIVVRKVLF